jgi:hypothetical protein
VIVELRQYTLRPGRRDALIDLFDREFVESQEDLGMAVLGQFRDLDRPDRFVWLRGFPDMATRAEGLAAFYSGPVWKEHGPAANATMIDSDDVLLLREVVALPRARPAVAPAGSARVVATVHYRDRPFDDEFVEWFSRAGTAPIASLRTEYAENTFPALPVREGEHAFVWFARPDTPRPDVPASLGVTATERLLLAPTRRSTLR